MKIIFLDIDGVLNSHRTAIAFGKIPLASDRYACDYLDDVSVRLIRGIANTACARFVLSSSWRLTTNWLELGTKMALPIIDQTKSLTGIRGDEIAEWLSRHEVDQYAIIDDNCDFHSDQLPHLVKTSGFDGFTWQNAVDLSNLLDINIYDVNRGSNHFVRVR